jgi:hypothetical protein
VTGNVYYLFVKSASSERMKKAAGLAPGAGGRGKMPRAGLREKSATEFVRATEAFGSREEDRYEPGEEAVRSGARGAAPVDAIDCIVGPACDNRHEMVTRVNGTRRGSVERRERQGK